MNIKLTYHLSKTSIDPKIKTTNYWRATTDTPKGGLLEVKHPHMTVAISGIIKAFLQEGIEFAQAYGEAPKISINIESDTTIQVDDDMKGIHAINMQ